MQIKPKYYGVFDGNKSIIKDQNISRVLIQIRPSNCGILMPKLLY